jgi:hypothetical protein
VIVIDGYVRCINGKGNAMHGYLITNSNIFFYMESKALILILNKQKGLLEVFEKGEGF